MGRETFKPGQKAPNSGDYLEMGETGSNVKNPKHISLDKGQIFPETSNHNRVWKTRSKRR